MANPSCSGATGTAVLEAVLAAGLLITILTGTLPLVLVAGATAAAVRMDVVADASANQRVAQFQALVHARTSTAPIIDLTSRPHPDGFAGDGAGLTPTGLAPLQAAMPAASEWLDERGTWLGDGSAAAPPGATHQRRWGIVALAGQECLRVWVEVRTTVRLGGAPAWAGSVQCPWGVAP